MDEKSKKMKSIISENRIKLHLFEPSQRKIWTVVGKNKEHWLDPGLNFCSCSGFYFGMLKNKTYCYHIESIDIAIKEKKFETIKFSDEEYDAFISSVLSDL